MGASRGDNWAAVHAEFERLGLSVRDLPGLAMDESTVDQFLARVRGMKPGVTWHDVLPDLPPEFVPGRFETWPHKYSPLGPYDYQELPTGPAVHIHWDRSSDDSVLDEFVRSARDAGWPIHDAGLIPISNPEWPTVDAMVILERGTTQDTLSAFTIWVEHEARVRLAAIPRTGSENYAGRGDRKL